MKGSAAACCGRSFAKHKQTIPLFVSLLSCMRNIVHFNKKKLMLIQHVSGQFPCIDERVFEKDLSADFQFYTKMPSKNRTLL